MDNDLQKLRAKISTSTNILIALAQNPSLDVVAAGLGLYLALKNIGKKVTIFCASEPTVRDSHLVAVNEIKSSVSGKNLVLTINVEGEVVDKVTSEVVDGKLNLTIITKEGSRTLGQEDIIFSSSGVDFDLTFVLGATSLSDIGELSTKESAFFAKTTLVNLSRHANSFGAINFVDPTGSLSELVTAILQELKLNLTQDIANNLMQGIEDATNDLQSEDMTADTFEALAILYRAGARHQPKHKTKTATIIDNTPIILERQQEDQVDIAALKQELYSMTHQDTSKPQPPEPKSQEATEVPNPDWLKPKIYKTK